MKYLFIIIFSLFSLVSFGQTGKVYKKELKERESKNKMEDAKNALISNEALDRSNYGYFTQFNERTQELNQNGVLSNEIQKDAQIQDLVQYSVDNFRDSYEYKMMQYVFNGKNLNSEEFIQKAYEMNPNDVSSYDEVLEYANWKNDLSLEKELASKIRASNKYDSEIYAYAKDLLASIPKGSVLITNGEIETITGKVLQLNDGVYNGVTIIKKDWLDAGRYSNERLMDIGLSLFDQTEDLQPNVQSLIESNPQKNFYLSLTLPKGDLEYMMDRLYLVGLAYQYSAHPLSNLENIEKNWKQVYSKKNIKSTENSHFGSKLMSNYLLSGIKLYYHHVQNGEKTKAKNIKTRLYEMALISGHSEKLKAWL